MTDKGATQLVIRVFHLDIQLAENNFERELKTHCLDSVIFVFR